MNSKMNTPSPRRGNLVVKAASIRKLETQRDKALSLVKILQESVFITSATRREKLNEMKRLASEYSVRSLAAAFNMARGTILQ